MQESRIRHLPIVDDHFNLVGLITQRDLLNASISSLHKALGADQRMKASVQISSVMQPKVDSISADDDLRAVATTMSSKKYGCMPVTEDDGKLIGIVTETDFLKLATILLDLMEGDERLAEAMQKRHEAKA